METSTHDKAAQVLENREVRIHIDRHPCESPNPTVGAALYVLGKVYADRRLFREVQGDEEDEPIFNSDERVHLKVDEHFYSEEGRHAGFDIIVNAQQEHVEVSHLSFEKVVKLAFPQPPQGVLGFTITYYNGPRHSPDGTLTTGHSVKIKNGMVFNVKATNRS